MEKWLAFLDIHGGFAITHMYTHALDAGDVGASIRDVQRPTEERMTTK